MKYPMGMASLRHSKVFILSAYKLTLALLLNVQHLFFVFNVAYELKQQFFPYRQSQEQTRQTSYESEFAT